MTRYLVIVFCLIVWTTKLISSNYTSVDPDWRIYLNHPNGKEVLLVGNTYRIFYATSYIKAVKIEYSLNSGLSWIIVKNYIDTDESNKENHLYFDWDVPNTVSKSCRVKITSINEPNISAISASDFEIRNSNSICKIPLTVGNKWFYKFESYSTLTATYSKSEKIEKIWEIKDSVKFDDGLYYSRIFIYSRDISTNQYTLSDKWYINQNNNIVTVQTPNRGTFIHDFTKCNVDSFNFLKKWLLRATSSVPGYTIYSLIDSLGIDYYDYYSQQYGWSRSILVGAVINKSIIGDILDNYIVGINENSAEIPNDYSLKHNFPNPFNPSTVIEYALPKTSQVKIIIYNSIGEEIRVLVDEEKNPGSYSIHFNGRGLSSGSYFCYMKTTNYSKVIKMLLIK